MDNIKLLQDKVIIVTGASRGLGREVALAYAREGATVVLIGRDAHALEGVYDEVLSYECPEPFAVTLDLNCALEADFEQLALSIEKATGKLDGIVGRPTVDVRRAFVAGTVHTHDDHRIVLIEIQIV